MARHWKCVADGYGTSFCPLECPVRPNDPIVNIYAYAHTDNICEVSQFRNQKAKKDQHDWQLYSMQKAHFGVISVQWSLCSAPVFITWMRHSFKKYCNAAHIKHIPSCCCCFCPTFFLYWGGKILGLLKLCVWVCVCSHWHVLTCNIYLSLFLFCYLQLLSTDSIEYCFLQGARECLSVLTSDVLFCCLEQKPWWEKLLFCWEARSEPGMCHNGGKYLHLAHIQHHFTRCWKTPWRRHI